MGRATRADVAKAAGVASSTVSLVLNGRGPSLGISKATIDRINSAAEQLSYIPRASARALRQVSSRVLGLVMAQFPEDPFVPVVQEILVEAVSTAQRHGYFVIPIAEPNTGDSDYAYVRNIASRIDLAGIVCETTSRLQFIAPLLASLDLPVVWLSMVNATVPTPGKQHVMIDEMPGVRQILDQLAVSDNAEVLYLTGPNVHYSRDLPVREAFTGRVTTIALSTWTPEAADLLEPLKGASAKTEVIWCANDGIALAALRAAQLLAIAVPDQWSIIGFGDEEPMSAEFSGLTTIAWPLRELTKVAFEQLVAAIETPQPLEGQFVVPSYAQIRRSARLRR